MSLLLWTAIIGGLKKIILVGNGGSAAMASHVSVDLTKSCKIRAINFNEADLLTCFSNDFNFPKCIWLQIKITIPHRQSANTTLLLQNQSDVLL